MCPETETETETDTDGTQTDADADRTHTNPTQTVTPEYRRDDRTNHDDVDPTVSFYDDLILTAGSRSDWAFFKRWHYLGDTIGAVSDTFVLWHTNTADENVDIPVGFVTIGPTALRNAARHEKFGRVLSPSVVNKWFSNVSRVVLDPRYRGAGLASNMLRAACRLHAARHAIKYIEAKTSMGIVNRFNQAAGFTLINANDQFSRVDGGDTEIRDYYLDDSAVRTVYEFIMDTENELDIELDYP